MLLPYGEGTGADDAPYEELCAQCDRNAIDSLQARGWRMVALKHKNYPVMWGQVDPTVQAETGDLYIGAGGAPTPTDGLAIPSSSRGALARLWAMCCAPVVDSPHVFYQVRPVVRPENAPVTTGAVLPITITVRCKN